jgi:hypothetical protein
LPATLPAQLWHGTGGGEPPAPILDLESIRDALRLVDPTEEIAVATITGMDPVGCVADPGGEPVGPTTGIGWDQLPNEFTTTEVVSTAGPWPWSCGTPTNLVPVQEAPLPSVTVKEIR